MSLTILLPSGLVLFVFFFSPFRINHTLLKPLLFFLSRAQTPDLLKSVFQANCFSRPSNLRKAAPAYLHVVSPRMFIGEIQVYATDVAVRRPASQGILLTRLVNGAVQRLEGSVRCSNGCGGT